jgi:hypothetical protein
VTIHKPWKFIWVHIHLINILDRSELERYAQSVSMSNWHEDIIRFLMKAIDIRKSELHNNIKDALAVSSSISID